MRDEGGMRALALFRRLGMVLATLLAVAFATETAARTAPSVSDRGLEVYQLLGGLVSDLCNTTGTDAAHTPDCSLCHLLTGGDWPGHHPSFVRSERARVLRLVLPQIRRARAHPRDPAIPPRGPPHA